MVGVLGLGCRDQGVEFWVSGLGCRVEGVGLRVSGLVKALIPRRPLRVWGLGTTGDEGLGCRVESKSQG